MNGSAKVGLNDQTREPIVRDEQVAASAQDKQRSAVETGECDRFLKFRLLGYTDKPARRAAYAERGVLRERNVF